MPGNSNSGRPSEKAQLALKGHQTPPEMPADLTGKHSKALWTLAVQSLPHVLRPIDVGILRLCCLAYELAITLADAGEHKQAAAYMRVFDLLAGKIGLTPHARRVVKPVPEKQELADDPFDEWMKRGGLN